MWLKKLLSCIYPLRLRTLQSATHGTLELCLQNGKLVIDSPNANQSFGSLQKVFEKVFELEKIQQRNLESVLMLGMGGASAIHVLRHKYKCAAPVTCVEVDDAMIQLASEFIPNNVQVTKADAYAYMLGNSNTYDLIISDIFEDNRTPDKFFEPAFTHSLMHALNSGGLLLANHMPADNAQLLKVKQLCKLHETQANCRLYSVFNLNYVFSATKHL